MKKTCFATILAVLLLTPSFAMAQRIGFVDIKEIIFQSDAGKKATAEFKKSFEKKRDMIQSKEAELKRNKEKLEQQRSAGILKDSALREMEHDYQAKFRDYQRLVADSNDELSKKDQELSTRLVPEIYKIIERIGDKEGFSLILDVNNPVVVYHAKSTNNLTSKVLTEFNRSFKK